MFYQADTPLEVLVLKSGIVKIYDVDERNNEKILQLVGPWAVLPLAFFSGKGTPTRWFYAALTDCEVYSLPFEEMVRHMRSDNEMTFQLMHWFSREAHELLTRLSSLGRTNARGKVEAALQFLGTYHAVQKAGSPWRRISFPVNHQLLADMTGITRESAAATMKTLQADHVSRSPRQAVLEINTRKLPLRAR